MARIRRKKGEKHWCYCLTCESIHSGALDSRDKSTKVWKNFTCGLCKKIRPECDWQTVYFPTYIPDVLSSFLGERYICDRCIRGIDSRIRAFHSCWAAPSEVLELACLIYFRVLLTMEASAQLRTVQAMTRNQPLPQWMMRIREVRSQEVLNGQYN